MINQDRRTCSQLSFPHCTLGSVGVDFWMNHFSFEAVPSRGEKHTGETLKKMILKLHREGGVRATEGNCRASCQQKACAEQKYEVHHL